jgi:hypothetical protein
MRVESKVSTVHFFGCGLTVPSLSQVQVELVGKVSQQFTFFLVQVVQFIVETQVGIVESKVSQQFLFLWCCRFVQFLIIPSTSKLLKVKVSQQFTFVGSVGLTVPSLSKYK